MREESSQNPVTASDANREGKVLGNRDVFPEPIGSGEAQQRHPRNDGWDGTRQDGPARGNALVPALKKGVSRVNKELWLILSMLGLAAAMNFLFTGHHMILGFYTFPTLFAAYFYGRRQATLTAIASVFLVTFLAGINPNILGGPGRLGYLQGRWYDITAWGGILVVTAYAMGTLHERHSSRLRELRKTYHGLLIILHHFISKDKYTENHSYRVSIYASKIAAYLGMKPDQIEDVRAASLLHDIGRIKTSRDLLSKASALTQKEYDTFKRRADKGTSMLEPVGGRIHRIIPIVLAHQDRPEGPGKTRKAQQGLPLEAKILAVADTYDALTSDRPYRRGISPFDAKESILKAAGEEFDSKVVDAFMEAFRKNEMESPEPVQPIMV
jgi:5'-deoxynucleotidase YfbR-like HD superfamily hydrolase